LDSLGALYVQGCEVWNLLIAFVIADRQLVSLSVVLKETVVGIKVAVRVMTGNRMVEI
jgi:hypothetical protein